MKDLLKPYVPEYKGHLTTDDGDRILCEKRYRVTQLTFNIYLIYILKGAIFF